MLKIILSCLLSVLPVGAKYSETFENPVIRWGWPDPTVWTDGMQYYTVATGIGCVLVSTDLINWSDSGEKVVDNRMTAGLRGFRCWAPDVWKASDGYKMYLTLYNSAEDCGIAVFKAGEDGPPFKFVRRLTWSTDNGIVDTIDPELVRDPSNGDVWMFFGSTGGIHRVRLDPSGEYVTGPCIHVAGLTVLQDPSRRKVFEGSYLHWHDGYWYLFVSAGNFWDHTYQIKVGRSASLSGEFLDRDGRKMIDGYATEVISSEAGDRFFGPGHNGEIITDDTGQDYIFYHCHDAKVSQTERQTYLQRIFWAKDGWPYVEGGKPALHDVAPVLSMRGKPRIEKTRARLEPGDTMALADCHVRKNSVLHSRVFMKDGGFEGVTMGRGGKDVYWGAWVKVTRDSAFVYERDYFDDAEQIVLFNSFRHGLDLDKVADITVVTTLPDSTGVLTVKSGNGTFESKIHWRGGGTPYLTNDGNTALAGSLSFLRGDACQDVWFIADSYFMEYDVERWPYYMVQEGRLDWMADHLPGGGSKEFIECFRNDLKYGRPKYAVWMMGMNDADEGPSDINKEWLDCTKEFLDLCESNGIVPVLTTIPSVPERCHDAKTGWVRESGYRYIDWSAAVGAKAWDGGRGDRKSLRKTGKHRGWNRDYLYMDEVHPSASGALVLWKRIKKDMPEL